jgi:hypothetical protein
VRKYPPIWSAVRPGSAEPAIAQIGLLCTLAAGSAVASGMGVMADLRFGVDHSGHVRAASSVLA